MARETKSVEAVLLDSEMSAGGYQRLSLLTRDSGVFRAMRRISRKAQNTVVPDLFDHCAVELERNGNGAWFAREYEALRRYEGLGSSYEALQAAARWGRLVLANATDMEDCSGLYLLSLIMLDALDKGRFPEAVLLKSLFIFARDEGLPAREEWFRRLPEEKAELASEILGIPLAALSGSTEKAASVAALADDIEHWMCTEHYISQPR